jgi:hypothetical protein
VSEDGTVTVQLASGAPGGRGGGRAAASGTSGTWVGSDIGSCGPNGEVWLNVAVSTSSPGPPTFTPTGVIRFLVLILPDGTVATTTLWNECLGQPLPEPPPSADAILEQAELPLAQVRTSPPGQGLVGFENWFWYEGPTALPVSAGLGGWSGTATAHAVRWTWDFGDGESASADTPGTARDPAVTHTYIRQGARTIVVTVTWEAAFTLRGWGTTIDTGLGSVDLVGEQYDYAVEEREAVIVG